MPLTSEGASAFERALREMGDRLATQDADAGASEALKDVLDQLGNSDLPEDERSRRARRLTEILTGDARLSELLLEAARDAAPELKAGVLAGLSPELRARMYGTSGSGGPGL